MPSEVERERDGKYRRTVDTKRESRGGVRVTLFSEGEKEQHCVIRFTGYARSSFW
jgi:hypothetical protein